MSGMLVGGVVQRGGGGEEKLFFFFGGHRTNLCLHLAGTPRRPSGDYARDAVQRKKREGGRAGVERRVEIRQYKSVLAPVGNQISLKQEIESWKARWEIKVTKQ